MDIHLERPPLPAGLYIVATPIGNLADITLRALQVLASADLIACEDTRVTAKLLAHYGIATRRVAYNDHNAPRQRPYLMKALAEGKSVALVSDAGTPLLSDPGYKLLRGALEARFAVTPIPGASALLTGLMAAGLPTDRCCFLGFLPPKKVARRKFLQEMAAIPATLVMFESPQRLAEALKDMVEILGDRQAAVARELTKLYEEFRRDTLLALATHYQNAEPPKGEITLVIGPRGARAAGAENVVVLLRQALKLMSVKDAAAQVASLTGMPKREVYRRALAVYKNSRIRGPEDSMIE